MLRKSLRWIRAPRALAIAAVGSLLALTSLDASAQANPAQQQVNYREALMTVTAANFGILGAQVQGKAPFNAQDAATRAERVAYFIQIFGEAFPESSKPGANVKTHAKAEIWTDKAEFDKLLKDAQAKAADLAKVAKGGKLDEIKPAFGAAGQACKACHDKFQEKH